MRFFQKNWVHIVIWAGMLLYLVFAQDIYAHFFVRNGKPVMVNSELPAETDQIKTHVDLFEPIVYDGQFLYSLVGWAYSVADPKMRPEDYERQVVLISDKRNYIFPVELYPRPDVHEAFQSLGMELTNAGYSTRISPDAIKPGIYNIGVIFNNPQNGLAYYAKTNKYLIHTPNQFQINTSPTLP